MPWRGGQTWENANAVHFTLKGQSGGLPWGRKAKKESGELPKGSEKSLKRNGPTCRRGNHVTGRGCCRIFLPAGQIQFDLNMAPHSFSFINRDLFYFSRFAENSKYPLTWGVGRTLLLSLDGVWRLPSVFSTEYSLGTNGHVIWLFLKFCSSGKNLGVLPFKTFKYVQVLALQTRSKVNASLSA